MTDRDRTRLRKLQDNLLSSRVAIAYIREHGEDYPLFGAGSPSASALRKYIYADWEGEIFQAMNDTDR